MSSEQALIIGESMPEQLFSIECLQKIYKILSDNGTLIIEHGGLAHLQSNILIPSIVKTLKKVGFKVKLYNPLQSNQFGDMLFVATKEDLELLYPSFKGNVLTGGNFASFEVPLSNFNNDNAVIITDDKNNADIMLKEHYLDVRKGIRNRLRNVK